MERIVYRNLNENVRGINDHWAEQELVANDLCRQIFEKYNYKPFKLNNFETSLFPRGSNLDDGTDYGKDDIIFYNDISEEDLLNLKQITPLVRYNDYYAIDYKSNNLYDENSVYVKLMKYNNSKQYVKGVIFENIEKDIKVSKKKRKCVLRSRTERYYNNNQILGDKNSTDYLFYVKYTNSNNEINPNSLICAYLVPAEPLRHQVINILNEILNLKDSKHLLELRKDGTFLNHKIMNAYQIYLENKDIFPKLELFVTPHKDLLLRIPEDILTPHIKFDNTGEIINRTYH